MAAAVSAQNNKPSAPGRPFAKGKSGNPGGRPKLESDIRALAQRHGPAAFQRLLELMRSDNERVAAIAAQAILDRGFGKPRQAVDIAGQMQVLWPLPKHPLEGETK